MIGQQNTFQSRIDNYLGTDKGFFLTQSKFQVHLRYKHIIFCQDIIKQLQESITESQDHYENTESKK